jgi:hypothetical protein
MKKLVFIGLVVLGVLGVVTIATVNVYLNNRSSYVSMMTLKNLEALGNESEAGRSCSTCRYGEWTSCGNVSPRDDYKPCVLNNGTGLSCSKAGSESCLCGVNCFPRPN